MTTHRVIFKSGEKMDVSQSVANDVAEAMMAAGEGRYVYDTTEDDVVFMIDGHEVAAVIPMQK